VTRFNGTTARTTLGSDKGDMEGYPASTYDVPTVRAVFVLLLRLRPNASPTLVHL
jgi:hypothetical protein